jgi:hypothetical protein
LRDEHSGKVAARMSESAPRMRDAIEQRGSRGGVALYANRETKEQQSLGIGAVPRDQAATDLRCLLGPSVLQQVQCVT